MRDHDIGSVLVVRATLPHDLLGIFTERDFIMKIDEIQHGGYWEKTVSTVMSHPVITVSVYEMGKAAALMKSCRIRHLPVVYQDAEKKQHIAGMISMRDIFSEMLDRPSVPLSVKIAISSRDKISRGILKTLFSQEGKAWVEEITFGPDILKEIAAFKPTAVVLDLDFVGPSEWAPLLQAFNRAAPRSPQVIVLFTPGFHEAKNVAILNKLGKSSRITAYIKPINVLEVLQKVQIAFTT
jgi:CBS domain-containing protein